MLVLCIILAPISVPESLLLMELLERYIHPTSSNPIARHQLSAYVASAADVEVLMEDTREPAVQMLVYSWCDIMLRLLSTSLLSLNQISQA